MRAQDLRLGNYINQNDGNGFYQVSVDIEVLKRLLSSDWEFQPIPLTEQWLVKLGFTRLDVKLDRYYMKGILAVKFTGLLFTIEYTHKHVHRDIIVTIEYVHQLQNLYFAMTGQELTIKEQL